MKKAGENRSATNIVKISVNTRDRRKTSFWRPYPKRKKFLEGQAGERRQIIVRHLVTAARDRCSLEESEKAPQTLQQAMGWTGDHRRRGWANRGLALWIIHSSRRSLHGRMIMSSHNSLSWLHGRKQSEERVAKSALTRVQKCADNDLQKFYKEKKEEKR